jgi:hypothetical protein
VRPVAAVLALLSAGCAKPQSFEEGMHELCALPDHVSTDAGLAPLVAAYKVRVTNVGVRALFDSVRPRPVEERDAEIAEALRIAGIGPCWVRAPDAGR